MSKNPAMNPVERKNMEKIKLLSGDTLELITCGVTNYNDTLTVRFIPENDITLSEYESLLSDSENTSKIILLSENDEELAIYSKYTEISSISKTKNQVISTNESEEITSDVVTVTLKKPDEIVSRLDSLEAQVTDAQMAMCELYEGMV